MSASQLLPSTGGKTICGALQFFPSLLVDNAILFGGAKNCTSYKSHYLSVHKYRIPYLNRHHPRQDYFHILPIFLWPPLFVLFSLGGSATTNSDDDGKANQCLNYIFLHIHFLFLPLLFPLPTDREKQRYGYYIKFLTLTITIFPSRDFVSSQDSTPIVQ